MTSTEIRQSFLDFFKSKQHTIVPSSSLLPDAPNLLFTNAGMNQFVPIFLGQAPCPYSPGRAADTQKCIRAGGKHNDLEDVGLDTYHHTFFEMLGNWSFGDYFKAEAIAWAWELVAGVWGFPKQRLYATVYQPGPGEPSRFDQEAYDHWAVLFARAGLDPQVHIRSGGKKDNFWMMGDTGPCGPCSELHVDLTPDGRTGGALVNAGSAQCIEIWNLVFMQFNANADGSFSPLPAKSVDTGMGFERVTGILQNTANFTDFSHTISNYETDIFQPLFAALERLSGRRYGSTLPRAGSTGATEQERIDVAFRVIADHIRTLGFAIADGIAPGNTDRHYVLRRILRRAVRYGRTLGFHEPFFFKLVGVLADTMGGVFPEIRSHRRHVEEVIRAEEEAFNKTLDRGLEIFQEGLAESERELVRTFHGSAVGMPSDVAQSELQQARVIRSELAFKLYDTYGFPLDLTELMAREANSTVDVEGFNRLMDEQRAKARAAQKKQAIELSRLETSSPTRFVGYETLSALARVLEVARLKDRTAVVLDASACYAEMGGQVGDTGELRLGDQRWRIVQTQKSGPTWLHLLERGSGEPDRSSPEAPTPATEAGAPPVGCEVTVTVDRPRREAIQRHHTATHLLHWALHEVVSREATQKGSFVGPDKFTFDFNSAPLTPCQLADVERLVNERILENAPVTWLDVKYQHVKERKDVMQFFGEKYGEWVRLVQIGGRPTALDGYSLELCGGTHTHATGEIGLFRLVSEGTIAAGTRRIEAVAGLEAYRQASDDLQLIKTLAGKVNSPLGELERKIEALLEHQRALEKQLKAQAQQGAAAQAKALLAKVASRNGIPTLIERIDADADTLQTMVNELKGQVQGVLLLGGVANEAVTLIATVAPEFNAKVHAGKLIQQIAPIVGGKGGGRPDHARGGGKAVAQLDAALAKAKALLE
ncbi:MAG: alanine--tRNA ligase [Verrucomicrobia bacterium]|nr:alanine--tRNA ligase [Verrucomicrobiota bacterium]